MKKLIFNYLKFFAADYLARTKPEIVAVTGSVGKTSAKEAIFEVLKIKFGRDVTKSAGNLNNESGVPLAILNFKKSPGNFLTWIWVLILVPLKSLFLKPAKVLVLELAADKPGDIDYLTQFIHPKIAVLTNIGPSHLSAFGTMDKIVAEKSALLKSLPSDGIAVVNLDNELSRRVFSCGDYRKKSYAIDIVADVTAENIQTKIQDFHGQTTFDLKIGDQSIDINLPTLGDSANVLAALAGAAVGNIYNIDLTDIARGLSQTKNENHRMNILKGKNNTTIIDDSYNANPMSMAAALNVLKTLPKSGRKIAVLGEMCEIGPIKNEAHQKIAELSKTVADISIEVGGDNLYGFSQNFTSSQAATEYLLKETRPGDIILIKASRAVKLDKIVESLKENSKFEIRNK